MEKHARLEEGKIILATPKFELMIERLCHQLIEEFGDFQNTCLIGIQERGVLLADRLMEKLREIQPTATPPYGRLDITFYRDDFRQKEKPLRASRTEMDFLVSNLKVILVDDVLYTGRTIQAAMTALQDFGRPQSVTLLTLVDRRFQRHLPIHANIVGMVVDALDDAYVKVGWQHIDGQDQILLFAASTKK